MPVRRLPVRPDLRQLEKEAADLLGAIRSGDSAAIAESSEHHLHRIDPSNATLADARLVLARSYEASSWARLMQAVRLVDAIWRDDLEAVRDLVTRNPKLLHEEALIRKNSNWGPPMTYAANVGRDRLHEMQSLGLHQSTGHATAAHYAAARLPPFTLVAATNRPEKLPRALESRFAIRERLETYAEHELAEIVERTAAREDRRFTDEAGRRVIARASRGTPREAVLLTKRLIAAPDAVLWRGLDKAIAEITFDLLEIDARGLDAADRKILETLKASKRPLGLTTLAAKTGIGAATILERPEPFLLRLELIEATPLGRRAC